MVEAASDRAFSKVKKNEQNFIKTKTTTKKKTLNGSLLVAGQKTQKTLKPNGKMKIFAPEMLLLGVEPRFKKPLYVVCASSNKY